MVDTGSTPYGAALADVDKDGNLDILGAFYRTARLSLYLDQGNQQYTPMVLAKPADGLTATTFADINNDGYLDAASGEFNADHFFYYVTSSYVDCVVKDRGDFTVTAAFEKSSNSSTPSTPATPTSPAPQPVAPQAESGSGGGGSWSWFTLAFVFSVAMLRRIRR